ncbi:SgcJ/EcaC family oxidoreductase [Frateuria sp. STR12]|uniref:nuclear transport factor 2 family protein n=1 Tax=Frateuria hangzhouensis TaxID=2995589 RepID=UPI00226103AE|nr:SgcJ/EcaC family oxidoreductase [Frateuria sp. STR12]MCX7513513.1 SgcJ/EcaC family oxidoreductase [Frateuria sp. STR12]
MTQPLLAIPMALALTLLPAHAMAACGSTTPASSPSEIVQAQVDAYNAHDVEAFAACYADDASMTGLSGKRPPVKGKAAIKQAYAGLIARQTQAFHVEILDRTASGPIVVDLERLHGLPPGRQLPDSFAIYEVRDGKIAAVWFPPAK